MADFGYTIEHCEEYVEATVGPVGNPRIVDCYSTLATVCRRKGLRRAMVVSAKGDPTDHVAMRDAIRALAVAGVAPGFRLAMIADSARAHEVYRFAEAVAEARGVLAKAFFRREEALRWLRAGG